MNENREALLLGAYGAAKGVFKEVVQPEITAKRTWLAIGATVVAHEIACNRGELLSEGWDKIIDKHPIMGRAVPLYTAAHIANVLPPKLDLFHLLTVKESKSVQ